MTVNDVAFLRKLPLLAKKCMHATGSMRRKAQCLGALLHVPLNTVFMLLAVCEEKTIDGPRGTSNSSAHYTPNLFIHYYSLQK